MILHCSFEELSALNEAAGRVLAAAGTGGVAAPPEVIADIEALSTRITGDLSIESLHEARGVIRALRYLIGDGRTRTDAFIVDQGPAGEMAILSYFEYANLLTLLERAIRLGDQMTALIEVMTGQPVTDESARQISFTE